jgi:branched-chain amino acid transport system substrate-binding protein
MQDRWRRKFLVVIVLASLAAFPAAAVAAETLRIGMLVPFTGPLALEGNRTWMGFQIAADMVNDKGGIWGKKIEFVKGDSVTPDSAIAEMERLITVEKVNIVAGGYSSSRVFAASEINEKYKKVYWVSTAVAENITSRGLKYIFRYNIPSSKLGGAKIIYTAEKIAPALGKKPADLRVAIIYEDSLWGTTTAKVETDDAPKYGLKIVLNESYGAKVVDLSPLIMKLRAARPDVILMTGYVNDTNLFWRQCKELDFNFAALVESGAVLGQPEWEQTFGKDVNGTLGMGNRAADPKILSPKGRETQKEYLKRIAEKFKVTHPGDHHLLSFEAGYTLFTEVLPLAGSLDPEKVREAALKINKSWKDSVNGMGCRYAPPGHAMAGQNLEATPFIHQWQNQSLVTLYPDQVSAGKLQIPMPTWEERKKMK